MWAEAGFLLLRQWLGDSGTAYLYGSLFLLEELAL